MTPQDIASKLKAKFGDKIVAETLDVHDPFCQVDPMSIAEVCAFMKDELGFNYLRCLSGVDYMDKKKTTDDLGVIYHLGAIPDASLLFCLKVILPRTGAKVATVENVWSTADWHEREAWDMFGIDFVGHHNQTRILCAEDWVGHALRKDYKSPDEYHGIRNNVV